jgi:hypothetical protein
MLPKHRKPDIANGVPVSHNSGIFCFQGTTTPTYLPNPEESNEPKTQCTSPPTQKIGELNGQLKKSVPSSPNLQIYRT